MIQIKTKVLSKAINSKKDFLFFNVDKNNNVTNYILTNDYKRKKEFNMFRVVSTIQQQYEYITL